MVIEIAILNLIYAFVIIAEIIHQTQLQLNTDK